MKKLLMTTMMATVMASPIAFAQSNTAAQENVGEAINYPANQIQENQNVQNTQNNAQDRKSKGDRHHKKDKDHRVSKQEFLDHQKNKGGDRQKTEADFDRMDKNGDGFLDKSENREWKKSKRAEGHNNEKRDDGYINTAN